MSYEQRIWKLAETKKKALTSHLPQYSSVICRKEFPMLGKCGRPYDISAEARPGTGLNQSGAVTQTAQRCQKRCKSRGVHTAPARPSYGRRNAANLTRHPGRQVCSGARSTVKCPYTRAEDMGPGAAFPLVDFNAPWHITRAAHPHANRTRYGAPHSC